MPFCQCTSTTHMPPPIDPDIVPQPRHAYTQSSVRVEHFQALILQGVYDLNQNEEWWRDQYGLLLSRGYKLRRRFRPDWTPSWLGTNLLPLHCEDSIRQIDTRVLDAIKLDDNTRISIKRVASGKRNELEMAKFLSKPEMRDDPANHCVPIIDCFDSTDEGFKLLIMPYLHKFDRVPFLFVDEALDFVQQTMEGLNYLHDRRITHRDLGCGNIMMDAEQLYPAGHHPVYPRFDIAIRGFSKTIRRRDVANSSPVKYRFIDFESMIDFKDSEKAPRVLGGSFAFGQDDDLPELRYARMYDPFPVDVFMLGNVYKKRLVDKYENLAFLKPLTSAMVRKNPDDRILAPEALALLQSLVRKQSWLSRRNRLREYGETRRQTILRDAKSFFREEVVLRTQNLKYDLARGLIISVALCAVIQLPIQSLVLIKVLVLRSVAS